MPGRGTSAVTIQARPDARDGESCVLRVEGAGEQQAVYTLNQAHSYDWLGWNAAFAALLLATGLGARRTLLLPAPLAWATIAMGASLLTPVGLFAFMLLPLWLIVVGIWLSRAESTPPIRSRDQLQRPDVVVAGNPST